MMIIQLQVSTNVMHDLAAVFTLFVFMLSLLCFCVLPFSSANKHLYIHHYDDRRCTAIIQVNLR